MDETPPAMSALNDAFLMPAYLSAPDYSDGSSVLRMRAKQQLMDVFTVS